MRLPPLPQLFKTIKNVVEIPNTQPRTNKIFACSRQRVLEGMLVTSFRKTIHTCEDPRLIYQVKITPSGYDIFVDNETLKIYSTTLG